MESVPYSEYEEVDAAVRELQDHFLKHQEPSPLLHILSIQLICCPGLELNYLLAHGTCEASSPQPGHVIAYHGTPMRNIASICKNGFLVSDESTGKTGGAKFGPGVYLSQDPVQAIPYCEGDNVLIACKVLVGDALFSDTHKDDRWTVQTFKSDAFVVARKSEQVVPIALVEVAYDEAAAILQKTDFEEPPLKELLRRLPKSMKRITTSKV